MLENNWMLIFTLQTSVGCIVKVRLFSDHLPAYLSEELSRCDWHLITLSPGFLCFDSHSFWPIQYNICSCILLLLLEQYLIPQIIFVHWHCLRSILNFCPCSSWEEQVIMEAQTVGLQSTARSWHSFLEVQFRITEHWIGAADVRTCSLVYLMLMSIKLQQG